MTFLDLDRKQLKAVVKPSDSRTIVVAGAGAGKTRCLTARSLYCRTNSDPQKIILCVTYTNKAAEELGGRLRKLMATEKVQQAIEKAGAKGGKGFWTGTLHSLALEMLKDLCIELWHTLSEEEKAALDGLSPLYREFVGKDPSKALLTEGEALKLWMSCVSDLRNTQKIPPKAGRFDRRSETVRAIWTVRACSIEEKREVPDAIPDIQAVSHPELLKERLAILSSEQRIATAYFLEKRKAKRLDFDDLLWMSGGILRLCPSFREKWANHLCHILIDEAQDLSLIDWFFLESLPGFCPDDKTRGIGYTLIGDPRQEIFGFRSGSYSDSVFWDAIRRKSWTEDITYLSTNYRSNQGIIALGRKIAQNSLLNMNYEAQEEAKTRARHGAEIGKVHWHLLGKKASLEKLLSSQCLLISQEREENDSCAILTRTNQQCEEIAGLLARENLQGFEVSTIHSAKGREWDHVFVLGLGPGKFPTTTSPWTNPQDNLRSEARLLYVAVTRARKTLHVFEPDLGEFHKTLGLVPESG